MRAQAVQPAIALVAPVACPATPPMDFTGQATLDLTQVRSLPLPPFPECLLLGVGGGSGATLNSARRAEARFKHRMLW